MRQHSVELDDDEAIIIVISIVPKHKALLRRQDNRQRRPNRLLGKVCQFTNLIVFVDCVHDARIARNLGL